MGEVIRSRMAELNLKHSDLLQTGFPNSAIVTHLINGSARLELKYVRGLSEVIQVNERQMMTLAVEGFLSTEDVPHWQVYAPTIREIELLETLRTHGVQPLKEARKLLSTLIAIQQRPRTTRDP
jgi:hypothetical protein